MTEVLVSGPNRCHVEKLVRYITIHVIGDEIYVTFLAIVTITWVINKNCDIHQTLKKPMLTVRAHYINCNAVPVYY